MEIRTSTIISKNQTKQLQKPPTDIAGLYEIYRNEFIDNTEQILLEKESEFLKKFFHKIRIIFRDDYGDDILNTISFQRAMTECEKMIITKQYKPMYSSCQTAYSNYTRSIMRRDRIAYNNINKSSSSSSNQNILTTNFRSHCIYNQLPIHTCKGKFISVYDNSAGASSSNTSKNNKIAYVICRNCKMCYYESSILMTCIKCKKDFFSSIISNQEKLYPPATWEKYHCNIMYNAQMDCIKCKDKFWIKNSNLFCKNCKFTINPLDVTWNCVVCRTDFQCGIKVYNPLEFKIIKLSVKNAMLYKRIVKPQEMPCNCFDNIDNVTFYHKQTCNGVLYYGKLSGKETVFCNLCLTLCNVNKFLWLCPGCGKTFISRQFKVYKSENKDEEDNIRMPIQGNVTGNTGSIVNDKYKQYMTNNGNNNDSHNHNIITMDKGGVKSIVSSVCFEHVGDKELKKRNFSINAKGREGERQRKNQSVNNSSKMREGVEEYDEGGCGNGGNSNNNNGRNGNEQQSPSNKLKIHVIKHSQKRKCNLINSVKFQERNTFISGMNSQRNNTIESDNNTNNNNNTCISSSNNSNIKNPVSSFNRNMLSPSSFINVSPNIYSIHINSNTNINNNIQQDDLKAMSNTGNLNINISRANNYRNNNIYNVPKRSTSSSYNNTHQISPTNTTNFYENTHNNNNHNDISKHQQPSLKLNYESSTSSEKTKPLISFSSSDEHKYINLRYNNNSPNNALHYKLESTSQGHNYHPEIKKITVNKTQELRKSTEMSSPSNTHNMNNNNNNLNITKQNRILTSPNHKPNSPSSSETQPSPSPFIKSPSIKQQQPQTQTLPQQDDQLKEFKFENYSIITQLGQGTFGKIYLVEDQSKNIFSMKKIILNEELDLECIIKEYQLAHRLKHANIVEILGFYTNKLDITTYVIYILMEVGLTDWEKDIKSHIDKKKPYTELELISILTQLISALYFLQSQGVSHRDIKPQNVLVFKNKVYKIADFGEAKQIEKMSQNRQINTLRGTELYMSPLLYNGLKTNQIDIKHNLFKSDVYSLGLCILFSATLTVNSIYDVRKMVDMKNVRNYLGKVLKGNYSVEFINLLGDMLEINEGFRPDFEELKRRVVDKEEKV